jgi:integrase/recombinase XerD
MSALPDSHSLLCDELINVNNTTSKLLNNPLISKDIWHTIDDLGLRVNQHDKALTISFELIQQDWLKLLVKLYTLVRGKRKLSANTLRTEIYSLNKFSEFKQKSITNPLQIDSQLFDEFNYYLHSSNLSESTILVYLKPLKNFFNLCREEGWLQVNTYWFKGKYKVFRPKRDEIEYIPEEVWDRLDRNLHHLPEPLQRMVLVIRGTGLRIGELLNLPLDCLRQREKQWRLRFLTEKYQTIDELPICQELVVIIKEQQEYIQQHFNDRYDMLFNSNNGTRGSYIPAPRVMKFDGFCRWLNKLAQEKNICTKEGRIWHFKSHQFRKTIATIMTNAGVRDLIIQKYLRHRSPEMQEHYKRLFKEVLGEEYQELMQGTSYVDSMGKLVAQHQPQNLITEAIRRKMYATTTLTGGCNRPILREPCETVNACGDCTYWITSIEDLPALKQEVERIDAELAIISGLGMIRQQQQLDKSRQNYMIRIESLEKINDRY